MNVDFSYFKYREPGETNLGGTLREVTVLKKANLILGLFLSALSIFVIVEAKKMPPEMPGSGLGPGVLPFWLGVGILVLSAILIAQSLLDKKPGKKIFSTSESVSVGIMFAAMVIYAILMDLLGFGLATLLLVFFLVRRIGNYTWWKCGAMGVIVAVVSVYLFRILLDMPLPTGIVGF